MLSVDGSVGVVHIVTTVERMFEQRSLRGREPSPWQSDGSSCGR